MATTTTHSTQNSSIRLVLIKKFPKKIQPDVATQISIPFAYINIQLINETSQTKNIVWCSTT